MINDNPHKSGIYKIVNTINGKCYVGSAVNLYRRCKHHEHYLHNDKHHSQLLQRAWDKYNPVNFDFVILEFCEKDKLADREQHWIDNLKPAYNIRKIAISNLGLKHTDETKELIRKGNLNKIVSIETRRLISESLKARSLLKPPKPIKLKQPRKKRAPSTEETKVKLRLARARKPPIGSRDKLNWPHELGSKCKCFECMEKKRAYMRTWKLQNKKILLWTNSNI